MAARSVLLSALLLLVLAALWAPGRAQQGADLPPSPPLGPNPAGDHTGLAAGPDQSAPRACITPCGVNERCDSGICICEDDYVNITGTCTTRANTHLGEPCFHPRQCQKKLGGYSTCTNGQCACSSDGVVANNTCYRKIGLDERCTHPEQCVLVENSACQADICLCKKGYVQWQPTNTSICIPVVNNYRGGCNISLQCSEGDLKNGATCVNGECLCTNEYYYDRTAGKCLYKKRLDEECNVESFSGCYLEDDGDYQHIECRKGVCQCQNKYSRTPEGNQCVSGATQAQLSTVAVLLLLLLLRL